MENISDTDAKESTDITRIIITTALTRTIPEMRAQAVIQELPVRATMRSAARKNVSENH